MLPLLHGAIDTRILKHLKQLKKSKCAGSEVAATTIKGLDEEAYRALQVVLLAEGRARKLLPVEYDDILFRQLNREEAIRGRRPQVG